MAKHYESHEAEHARKEFEAVNEAWAHGDGSTRAVTAARSKWHKLRDRDAEVEAAVREQLEPSELREAAEALCAAVSAHGESEVPVPIVKASGALWRALHGDE